MSARMVAFVLALLALPAAASCASPAGASVVLRLTFVGDIMAHEANYRMAEFRDIYRGVEDIFKRDDLTFANLEMPVDPTRPETGYPLFNGAMEYVRAAVAAGIDAFSTANNHAFDGGEEGIFQTLRSLRTLGASAGRRLYVSGIRGNPRGAFLPEAILARGVRIGFVAVTQFLNEPDAGRYVHVVDYNDQSAVEGFLRFTREVSPLFDLFIVSYHGDNEYVQEPSEAKRVFFRRLLEAGAHIVFSHHPHVVQGYEVVRVAGADRLIMYSMGNFISGMTEGMDPVSPDETVAETGEGYLLSVEVRYDHAGCTVSRVEPVPVANYRNARGETMTARLLDLATGVIELPAVWRSFYAQRLQRMLRFLSRSSPAPAETSR